MLGTVFSGMDEDGAARRWLDDSIAMTASPTKAAAHDGVPAEHVRKIIEVVVADNSIKEGCRLDDGLE